MVILLAYLRNSLCSHHHSHPAEHAKHIPFNTSRRQSCSRRPRIVPSLPQDSQFVSPRTTHFRTIICTRHKHNISHLCLKAHICQRNRITLFLRNVWVYWLAFLCPRMTALPKTSMFETFGVRCGLDERSFFYVGIDVQSSFCNSWIMKCIHVLASEMSQLAFY